MPPEEFRALAHGVADWIADYLAAVERHPVLAQVRPGELRAALPPDPPARGEAPERILDDFETTVLPAVTHWNHPGFLAYFAVTGSGPGILGEMLAAALNVNAMVWRTSPAGTELEAHTLDWLRALLGLPPGLFGVVNDTASHSSLYALAAAREAALPEAREAGLSAVGPVRVYASAEAHSSIDKAAVTLGFGLGGIRRIPCDGSFRMRPDLLRAAILEDRLAGVTSLAVVATAGTTSTASMDPIAEIAEITRELGLWLHVDAAYAGPAAILPRLRPLFEGWEQADSVVVNPHKWLFTPIDCSVLYTRRPEILRRAFSVVPEYLRTPEEGETHNLMDYGVALGRRFRALKLWFVLRYFGREGIAARIDEHCRLARGFADRVEREPGWRVLAPVLFSTVAFRYDPPGVSPEDADVASLAILERVNAGGEVFLSHTRLGGRVAIRLSVGNLRTAERHLDRAWELLREAAGKV